MILDLARIISTISASASDGYAARPIPGSSVHFVGRDISALPVLLLGSRDAPHSLNTPIRLKGIEVQFATPCRIALPDGQIVEHRLSVVRCVAEEPEVQRYFLQIAETILRIVGVDPSYTQVTGAVRRMIDLFQQLLRPPAKEILGLYGELLVIAWSANANDAIRAWHNVSEARFDFALDDLRMDVKTSSGRVRAHRFSLDQCRPPPATTGVIASLLVERGSGASLGDLVEFIEARVTDAPALQMKVHEIVAESLGAAIAEGLRTRFDDRAARGSFALFFVGDIPAPTGPIPPAVSEVRFRADLSAISPRDRSDVVTASVASAQLLPAP